jgi:UDP-glucose 4-epimerase
VHGTELVLEAAAKKLKKVVLASSSEVYGKSAHAPYREDDDMVFGATTKSRWSYGCAKAIDEFLALAYHADAGLPVVVARLFNTVGPRQVGRYGMVLPRFVEQALAGGPITVYDDGEQERCFTYVGDVVEALVVLASDEKAVGGVFNVGSETPVSMNELARRVRERVDSAIEIVHMPYDVAYEAGFEDVRRRVPDCSRIRALTGWRPAVDLERIIDIVVEDRRAGGADEGGASR